MGGVPGHTSKGLQGAACGIATLPLATLTAPQMSAMEPTHLSRSALCPRGASTPVQGATSNIITSKALKHVSCGVLVHLQPADIRISSRLKKGSAE